MSGQFKSLSMNGASVSLVDEFVEVRLNVAELNNVTSMNETTKNTIKGIIDTEYVNGVASTARNNAIATANQTVTSNILGVDVPDNLNTLAKLAASLDSIDTSVHDAISAAKQDVISTILGGVGDQMNTLAKISTSLDNDADFNQFVVDELQKTVDLKHTQTISGLKTFTTIPLLDDSHTDQHISSNSRHLISKGFADGGYVSNTEDGAINHLKTFARIPRIHADYIEPSHYISDDMLINKAYLKHLLDATTGPMSISPVPQAATTILDQSLKVNNNLTVDGLVTLHGNLGVSGNVNVVGTLHAGEVYTKDENGQNRQLAHLDSGSHTGTSSFDYLRVKPMDVDDVLTTTTTMNMFVDDGDSYAYIEGNTDDDALTIRYFPSGIELLNDTNIVGNLDVTGAVETNSLTIQTDANSQGLRAFTGGSSTTPNVMFGRNANEYWGVAVSDREARLVHRQDETNFDASDGTGVATNFELWSATIGRKTFKWKTATTSGGYAKTIMSLEKDGSLKLYDTSVSSSAAGGLILENDNGTLKWNGVDVSNGVDTNITYDANRVIDWTVESDKNIDSSNYTNTVYDDTTLSGLVGGKASSARVDALEASVVSLSSQVTTNDQNFQSISSNTQTGLAGLEAQIASLQATILAQNAAIVALQGRCTELEYKDDAVFAPWISALEDKLDELESKDYNKGVSISALEDRYTSSTFCIWAEERFQLNTAVATSEWSFGDSATGIPTGRGLVIGVRCRILAMTLDVGNNSEDDDFSTVSVMIVKDGVNQNPLTVSALTDNTPSFRTFTGLSSIQETFDPGNVINFRTTQGSGRRAVVTAWFERIN